MVAFVIYSISDFIAWRLAFRSAVEEYLKKKIDRRQKYLRPRGMEVDEEEELEKELIKYFGRGRMIFVLSKPASIIRVVFEFLLPIIAALYTILSLILYKPL